MFRASSSTTTTTKATSRESGVRLGSLFSSTWRPANDSDHFRPFLTLVICYATDALSIARNARLRAPAQRAAAFHATPAADAARFHHLRRNRSADSRWIRGVKAHRAAAAHQAIASTPPASPPSKTPTPPPAITPSTTTLRRHAPLPRLPAEDFKIVFRPGGGLDLRTTTNGALLQILCTLATIDYATARTADRVRINPYNNSLTISTPSEPRARLYLRVSELRLGPTSYPLRAYMAAPDNALRGIIYNAVDSQTRTRSSKIYKP
ncbi:hypothetical protein HPB49_024511 [Dermacentor silvarum]|uniref:Uncharacterized protein n=1 Tax=Dermacentor silvarum TaxID=543639 RepID=A0ACB8CIA5_DERSI|nr:hypothetical protein HPB49_024511 [Dermacentor silvarum]